MGITISFMIQKGGVGKTTVTGMTSFLLSHQSKRVLAVDFDSQGNLTQFLSQKTPYTFTKQTSFEACKSLDAKPFIHPISDNLDLLPAEDFLSQFGKFIYTEYPSMISYQKKKNPYYPSLVLKETLQTVKDDYDYILIDLPPNLGEQTLNGMTACDYAVVMLQAEPFCYDALDRCLETLESVRDKINPDLCLAGILTSMFDQRTSLGNHILNKAKEEYGKLIFNTTITRKARIPEMNFEGIQNNTKRDKETLFMYESFLKELLDRVK